MRAWLIAGLIVALGAGWAAGLAGAADAKAPSTPAGTLLKLLDADSDGKITEKEYKDGFAKIDTTADDALSQDEIMKALKEKPKTGNATAKTPSVRLFELMDADADGKVTRAEYEKAFAKLDKDGDGSLTEEELKSTLTPAPGGRKKK
jgi:Ca2+-binding EF-hand superfamily protein